MHDTSLAMDNKMREIIRAKSPLERLTMGCSMYDTSRYLIKRSILENNPSISKKDLRIELFLKFYRNDFSAEQCERITQHFQK